MFILIEASVLLKLIFVFIIKRSQALRLSFGTRTLINIKTLSRVKDFVHCTQYISNNL